MASWCFYDLVGWQNDADPTVRWNGAGNTVTFPNGIVEKAGTYQMEIDHLTCGPRSFFITVNGGPSTELDLNGSDTGYAPALDCT